MKKITSIVLALIMVLSSFAVLPMTVSAAVESSTVVDSKDVKVGDTFEVNVSVANYSNVASLGFVVPGTSANLEYVGVTNNTSGPTFVETDMGNGTYAIALAGVGVADAIATANGKPITLKYKALAAGEVTLAVEVKEMLEGADGKESYSATGGAITIAEEITPDVLIEAADIADLRIGDVGGETNVGAYDEDTGLITATTEAAISSSDNENAFVYLKYAEDGVAMGDPAIKYVKVGYKYDKGSLSHKTGDNLNIGMKIGGTSGRFWGFSTSQFANAEGDWLVNLDCTGKDGENIGGQYANAVATDTYTYLRFTPWADGQTIPAGTTFSVEYIAFFSDANDAANYVYEGGASEEEDGPAVLVYGNDDTIIYTLGGIYAKPETYEETTAIFKPDTVSDKGENWDNDGSCADVTVNGLNVSTANKYYVFGMTTYTEYYDTNCASFSNNVALYVDGVSVGAVSVDLKTSNSKDVTAHVVDASSLITSGTALTKIVIDPLAAKAETAFGNKSRFGANGLFKFAFIAAFDSLAAAEAYAAEFNGGEEAPETVTVTFKVDGEAYGEPVVLEKGAALVYPEVAPTKDGYTFTGWDVAEGSAINADTVVNAIFEEDEVVPVEGIVYYGDDLTVNLGNAAKFPSTYAYDAANAAHTYTSTADGANHDTNRFEISFDGVDANKYQYIAVGLKVTDDTNIVNKTDNFNVNMTIGGTQTRMWGGKITIPSAEIGKVVAYAKTCSGGDKGLNWTQVTADDVINGVTINPWGQSPAKVIPTGTVVAIQYVALFETEADANAFVFDVEEAAKVEVTYMLDGQVIATQKYTPGEALVYPEVEAPKGYEITGWNVDEGTIVEDAMTVQAFFNEVELPLVEDDVLGKDLEITWGSYYSHKESHKVEVVGNNTVATASSDWQNDGCADFTIKNVPVDGKYLVLNIEASSDKAALATEDNITIGSLVLDADFTAGSQFVFDISALGDIDTISSINVRAFKAQGGQLENVKVVVGSVSTAPYAITLDGELVAVADEGALYELPVAVSDEAGMRFIGWTDDTDMYLAGTKIEMNADLVLTPEFEAASEWYVTYIVNGEVYEVVTVALNGEVAHPTAPAMEGYKFAGWYNEAGERVINGDAVTNDMTLTANFTEAGDDEEFLGTMLTILKMITAKKADGGSTAGSTQAGTTTGATTSSTPVVVYTGEQITVKPQGSIASAEAAVNAAGNVEVKIPAGTGGDSTRIYIITEGAETTTPYMAVGLKLTNATKAKDVFCPMVNASKRFWSPSDADANGNNQTFSATAIVNHVVDFTAFADGEISGGWSGVTSSDVLTGVSVNAWTYDQAFAAGTMEIAYVAFFKTLDDAKAYVHGAVAEEAPAEEPKEEVKEEEPAVSANAILGKDLEIEWGSYWKHAGNNPSISVVGNNTVATGDSNWQNDGCAIFTIKNVAIEKGAKTLVLNIKASSEGENPARPNTANNIVITAGGNSKTYSFDFTNATEELTAIELDISNFKNVTKLDSIQLDVFANNKVETAVGNLYGVEVIIGAIECK